MASERMGQTFGTTALLATALAGAFHYAGKPTGHTGPDTARPPIIFQPPTLKPETFTRNPPELPTLKERIDIMPPLCLNGHGEQSLEVAAHCAQKINDCCLSIIWETSPQTQAARNLCDQNRSKPCISNPCTISDQVCAAANRIDTIRKWR